MKSIDIKDITINEDGSATLDIEMTEETQKLLLEYAIRKILEGYIKECEEKV